MIFLRILAIILLTPIMLPCALFTILASIPLVILAIPSIFLLNMARGYGLDCLDEIRDFLVLIGDFDSLIFRAWFGLEE